MPSQGSVQQQPQWPLATRVEQHVEHTRAVSFRRQNDIQFTYKTERLSQVQCNSLEWMHNLWRNVVCITTSSLAGMQDPCQSDVGQHTANIVEQYDHLDLSVSVAFEHDEYGRVALT